MVAVGRPLLAHPAAALGVLERGVEGQHRGAELGLSQQDLAGLCGTTQSAIARLESGGRPPRIDTLLKIAEALDCELAVELRPNEP